MLIILVAEKSYAQRCRRHPCRSTPYHSSSTDASSKSRRNESTPGYCNLSQSRSLQRQGSTDRLHASHLVSGVPASVSGQVLLGFSIKERNTELNGRCFCTSPLECLTRTSEQFKNGLYITPRVTSHPPHSPVAVRDDHRSNTPDRRSRSGAIQAHMSQMSTRAVFRPIKNLQLLEFRSKCVEVRNKTSAWNMMGAIWLANA